MKRDCNAQRILAFLALALAFASAHVANAGASTFQEFPRALGGETGPYMGSISVDGDGGVWFTDTHADGSVNKVGRLVPSQAAPGTSSGISEWPTDAAATGFATTIVSGIVGAPGSLAYVGMANGPNNAAMHGIYSVSSTGAMTPLPNVPYLSPRTLALSPTDQSLWFTAGTNRVGEVPAPYDGAPVILPPTPSSGVEGIGLDAQGHAFFAEGDLSGTPAIGEVVGGQYAGHFHTVAGQAGPGSVTVGHDGKVWFIDPSGINEFDPAQGEDGTTKGMLFFAVPSSSSLATARALTTAADGSIWFTRTSGGAGDPPQLGRIDPPPAGSTSATFTMMPIPSGLKPHAITADAQGNIWFTAYNNSQAEIGELQGATAAGSTTGGGTPPSGGGTPPSGGGTPPAGGSTPPPDGGGTTTIVQGRGGHLRLAGPVKVTGKGADTAATAKVACDIDHVAPGGCSVSMTMQAGFTLNVAAIFSGGQFVPDRTFKTRRHPRKKVVVVGLTKKTLAPGSHATVTVHLNKKGKRLLRRYHRLYMAVTVAQKRAGKRHVLRRARLTARG